jgi:class 3 adenylate cyclase
MEPAPELEALARQFLEFFEAKDPTLMMEPFSRQPGTLAIGTATEEWWSGHDVISAALNVQLPEMPDFTFPIEMIEAWREGTVGWMSVRASLETEEGRTTPFRVTLVARKEGAYWRIVNMHASGATPNEEILGRTLTTAFDELVELVADEPAPASAMGPDGDVTIAFTDIESSTALMEQLGEASWSTLVEWHNEILTRHTAAFGGIVVKGLGDGFMLAFPATGAATACAIAIQKSLASGWNGLPVSVRIGIHSGNAREASGDFFGRTVIIAARIASAAGGREILVSQDVQGALGGAFELGEPETMDLKGLSGSYTVFPVLVR